MDANGQLCLVNIAINNIALLCPSEQDNGIIMVLSQCQQLLMLMFTSLRPDQIPQQQLSSMNIMIGVNTSQHHTGN